jgi:hypothetical protein
MLVVVRSTWRQRCTVRPAVGKQVGGTEMESLFLSQSYKRFVLTIAH